MGCGSMESEGWSENHNKRFGGLRIFERNNKIKEIINTLIKTVIVDGKLNIVVR